MCMHVRPRHSSGVVGNDGNADDDLDDVVEAAAAASRADTEDSDGEDVYANRAATKMMGNLWMGSVVHNVVMGMERRRWQRGCRM